MWPFEYKYNVQCFWLKRILNIIIQAGIFRDYRNTCFWRPKCFGKAIPQIMMLRILSGKGAVQIMPFRKLGGKCHFFLRFCTRKRSETYCFNVRWQEINFAISNFENNILFGCTMWIFSTVVNISCALAMERRNCEKMRDLKKTSLCSSCLKTTF